jgi:hypothetical protein
MKSIILDYAIERKGEIQTVYQYDFSESLNVIYIDDRKIAFIDSTNEDISLLTQTRVLSESDDENISMLELQTKTKVDQERDDEGNLLLELKTKTFTMQERDDESFNYN